MWAHVLANRLWRCMKWRMLFWTCPSHLQVPGTRLCRPVYVVDLFLLQPSARVLYILFLQIKYQLRVSVRPVCFFSVRHLSALFYTAINPVYLCCHGGKKSLGESPSHPLRCEKCGSSGDRRAHWSPKSWHVPANIQRLTGADNRGSK